MTFKLKNLLSGLGISLWATVAAGCVAGADEPKTDGAATTQAEKPVAQAGTNITNISGTNVTSLSEGPNVAASTGGTNNVGDAQLTVVKTIPPSIPENLTLSKAAQEVVRLAQSGLSDAVILLYVQKSTERFELSAADIVYLNDIGLSSDAVAAMLNHDGANADVQNPNVNQPEIAATAPTNPNVAVNTAPAQSGPIEYQVTSNYVANAPSSGVVMTDPYAQQQAATQQPVIIQPDPVVVQQPVVVESDPAVTYDYFYSSLSPYGSWAYVSDYGWCWQPTIAVAHTGWRPYAHGGRWLSSDAGWYWHSDYSWGWAPFHYGRWFCAPRVGWVWTPDFTWGPSWVTWRRSGDYCGWAPLPPRCYVRPGVGFTYWNHNVGFNFNFGFGNDYFTFVQAGHFADRRLINHVIPTERTSHIYRNSTVVNNYIVGNNNTIVNNGISRDYVASRANSEIPRVAIREESRAGRSIPADRVQRAGGELVVYRPTAPSARAETALREKQERIRPSTVNTPTANGIAANSERPTINSAPAAGKRPEVTRPQVTRNEMAAPVFGKPQPIRPEPERTIAARPVRSTQEPINRNAIAATPARPGNSGLLSTTSPTGRPETLAANNEARTVTPTLRPSAGIEARATQPNNVFQSSRPSVLNQSSTPARTDVSNIPGRSEIARNATPAPQVARPNVTTSPALRPAPNSGLPTFTPRNEASVAPQPIRPQNNPAPIVRPSVPAVNRNEPIPTRNENFGNRPISVPVQRPQISVPSASIPAPVRPAPIQAEAPRVIVPSRPAAGGAPVHVAPQAPVARPSQAAPAAARPNAPQSNNGRGRVEIGR